MHRVPSRSRSSRSRSAPLGVYRAFVPGDECFNDGISNTVTITGTKADVTVSLFALTPHPNETQFYGTRVCRRQPEQGPSPGT